MTDYDRFRSLALRLAKNFGNGGTVTFTRAAVATFDPISGVETAGDPITATAVVVVLPDTDASREEARILGWDVRFMCPVIAGFVPAPGDAVALPGRAEAFTVVAPVEAPAPDGDAICYTIRARRG